MLEFHFYSTKVILYELITRQRFFADISFNSQIEEKVFPLT